MSEYARVAREQSRTVRDHTAVWNRLTPIGNAADEARAAIARFCEQKRIGFDALEALGTRVVQRDAGYCLAYGGSNGNGKIVAIKYRPMNGTSHDSFAEQPSVWLRPIVDRQPQFTRLARSSRAKQMLPVYASSLATTARSWCCRPGLARSSANGRL